ncbi:MAG: amidase [Acidobacteria bacterium]|nr:MAG: amidase [Acidobacteriota bacterium]
MQSCDHSATRRAFIGYFSSVGLGSTLLPGVLWAKLQEEPTPRITAAMLKGALTIAGLDFSDEDQQQMLTALNQNPDRFTELRKVHIDPDVAPPLYYSPIVPGTRLDRVAKPFRASKPRPVRRPATLEDAAFWPIADLAQLIKTRQVTSVELTRMSLDRLQRFNPTLNFVVTMTDDLAMKQARQADQEIAAGKYRGPLHGIPWGCKDIISVPGYPTQWGSGAFKGQTFETEATVVRLLRDAGAVLVAKLTTGELASGDQWFGGRTNNPWDPAEGSSGSSAGPASATAAGCVAFGIGTETSGSILSPATRCGVSGLRPTFGRVSRYGAMTLSWTQDRLGPLCRTVEDCALVFNTIAKTDEHDLSAIDIPFNWDVDLDITKLRVGYLEPAFREANRSEELKKSDQQVLDQLKKLGVKLEPFELPRMPNNVTGGILGAESGASFDEFVRSGRDKSMTNRTRGNGFRSSRLVPAVEYLQAQRVRGLVMRQFADAVSKFDVYVVPFTNARGGAGARGGRGTPDDTGRGAEAGRGTEETGRGAGAGRGRGGRGGGGTPSAMSEHFQIANLCGYPAVAVPHGFTADGKPTSITFLGRLYNEAQILAVAKAYQDATGWHLKHPAL